MTERAVQSTDDLNKKLRALSSQLRMREPMSDEGALVPALYLAWLCSLSPEKSDAYAVLAESGLPDWAQERVAKGLGEAAVSQIEALVGSNTSDELRGMALAAFDALAAGNGRMAGEFVTPHCVTSLAAQVLRLDGGVSVADFGCGWGGFLVEASKDAGSLYGVDSSTRAADFAAMRMDLLGVECELMTGNMMELGEGRTFDRCFCQVPFGMRLRDLDLKGTAYEGPFYGAGPLGRSPFADWTFVQRVLDGTAQDGRAVIIMGNGATFNHSDARARAHFARSGRLEAVVALPARLFSNTSVASTMVVFGDGSKGVRLVDATDLSVSGRRTDDMGTDEIAEVLKRLAEDGPMSRLVGADELEAHDWSLAPQRYLRRKVELENATPLGEAVVTIERGVSLSASKLDGLETSEDTGLSYLPVSALVDGRVEGDLPHITSLDPKWRRARLRDGDVVMTKNGSPVRVAVIEVPEGQTIVATANLYILRLDTSRVDPHFLAAFLSSGDGRELVDGLATGSVIPTIALRDLRGLEIPVPPMDAQRRVAARYRAALDEVEAHKAKLKLAREAVAGAYAEETRH